ASARCFSHRVVTRRRANAETEPTIHQTTKPANKSTSPGGDPLSPTLLSPPVGSTPPADTGNAAPRSAGGMMMLINCSGCRTPLQLPHGAPCIRCAICGAVTHVAPAPHAEPSRGAVQPAPGWGPPPPPAHGRKRAVVCGISYRYSRHELKGCINDAKCMRHLLMTRFNFPDDSIIMLNEEQTDPYKIPTKHNIRMAMYWLVQGCQPGDSLVFHYSGHGSQQRNYSGDEVDGFDETLCPLDFET
ncbi:unnamed protein product, partial [Urochloa humidicola]